MEQVVQISLNPLATEFAPVAKEVQSPCAQTFLKWMWEGYCVDKVSDPDVPLETRLASLALPTLIRASMSSISQWSGPMLVMPPHAGSPLPPPPIAPHNLNGGTYARGFHCPHVLHVIV